MTDNGITILVGFGGIVLGFALSFGGDLLKSIIRESSDKKNLAKILRTEIFAQA